MNERIFTYDEFYASVEKQVVEGRAAFPQQEVKAFVKENEDMVKEEYEDATKKYNDGKYTADTVNIGATSSVAYCLQLMF